MTDFAVLFVLFYIAHKIGDYWVQTDWQAQNKAKRFDALLAHGTTYGLTFVPFMAIAAAAGIVTWWHLFLVPIAITAPHMWFDTRKPLDWYWVHVKKLSLDPASHPLFATLRLEMDQGYHIATLALAAAVLVIVG